jgi:nicotinamidase-related amidase
LVKPALLVIDMQHDFVDRTGSVPCHGASSVVPKIKRLVEKAHETGIPVIYTRELHRANKVDLGRELDGDCPLHCVQGTRGAEIVEDLNPGEKDYVIDKRRYSCFLGTDLLILLKGLDVDILYLTGVATDVCVYLTAMDAHQLDYKVKIVEDCVAGTSKAAHKAALAAVERLQKGSVIRSPNALQDLEESSIRRRGREVADQEA